MQQIFARCSEGEALFFDESVRQSESQLSVLSPIEMSSIPLATPHIAKEKKTSKKRVAIASASDQDQMTALKIENMKLQNELLKLNIEEKKKALYAQQLDILQKEIALNIPARYDLPHVKFVEVDKPDDGAAPTEETHAYEHENEGQFSLVYESKNMYRTVNPLLEILKMGTIISLGGTTYITSLMGI